MIARSGHGTEHGKRYADPAREPFTQAGLTNLLRWERDDPEF